MTEPHSTRDVVVLEEEEEEEELLEPAQCLRDLPRGPNIIAFDCLEGEQLCEVVFTSCSRLQIPGRLFFCSWRCWLVPNQGYGRQLPVASMPSPVPGGKGISLCPASERERPQKARERERPQRSYTVLKALSTSLQGGAGIRRKKKNSDL